MRTPGMEEIEEATLSLVIVVLLAWALGELIHHIVTWGNP